MLPISFISYLFLKKKSCSKTVKRHFCYSAQKDDDSITKYFPFTKREFPSKVLCCVYIMRREFSGSFPDYTIFICKFKINECFLFTKRFYIIS